MKKTIMVLSSMVLSAMLLGACGSSSDGTTNDSKVAASTSNKEVSVKDDLISYINDHLTDFDARQTEIADMYGAVSGENYTDDETMFVTIEEKIIPTYQPLIADMEAVRPKTAEVRELHETLISANNTQFNAMSLILAALDSGDYAKINEANTQLDSARKQMRDFATALEDLAAKHKVTIEYK